MRRRRCIGDRKRMRLEHTRANEDTEVDVLGWEPAGVAVWNVDLLGARQLGKDEGRGRRTMVIVSSSGTKRASLNRYRNARRRRLREGEYVAQKRQVTGLTRGRTARQQAIPTVDCSWYGSTPLS